MRTPFPLGLKTLEGIYSYGYYLENKEKQHISFTSYFYLHLHKVIFVYEVVQRKIIGAHKTI